ncbi:amidohydrolase family protein [Agaribacter marinus]|uniref:Amidohydrolase n=1 Tax=Agaribacter marinus TaxID=1431249 RepID=A0AA37SX92_9ALTE|nr:amidohydrolase family protein [Agaribacter marinus]GLR69840.1 amidohydrolase [Agaribacter marinus]
MRVDAHHHLWEYQAKDYAWIGENERVLMHDFLPNDLKHTLEQSNIEASVAVQARQSLDETRWLIKLAEDSELIKGVVGWADLRSEHLTDTLQEFRQNKCLKGFRHVVQDEADPRFMLSAEFIRGLCILYEQNYAYDILVFAKQLPQCIELLPQLPKDMRIVVDHIAKPEIKNATNIESWQVGMKALAAHKNVFCKLSGMVTEASHDDWTVAQLIPYIEHVFKVFGPERIMFGSDWPVCLLAAKYKTVVNIVEQYITDNYPAHVEDIMGGNAVRFYQLSES